MTLRILPSTFGAMAPSTAKAKLLDNILNQSGLVGLDELVGNRRKAGDSWRAIAAELTTRTREQVSDVNLITWYSELDKSWQDDRAAS